MPSAWNPRSLRKPHARVRFRAPWQGDRADYSSTDQTCASFRDFAAVCSAASQRLCSLLLPVTISARWPALRPP
jgi:hypothetical protein